jgi:hypothetical protein
MPDTALRTDEFAELHPVCDGPLAAAEFLGDGNDGSIAPQDVKFVVRVHRSGIGATMAADEPSVANGHGGATVAAVPPRP